MERQRRSSSSGGDEKGNAQPGGVHEQEPRAFERCGRLGGGSKDEGEHRADAGGPARGKGHAGEEGAGVAELLHPQLDARLLVEEGDADEAEHVDAEDDEDDAGEMSEQKLVYELGKRKERRPDGDEDDRKAADKGESMGHDLPTRDDQALRSHGRAAQVTEIDRDERKDAG